MAITFSDYINLVLEGLYDTIKRNHVGEMTEEDFTKGVDRFLEDEVVMSVDEDAIDIGDVDEHINSFGLNRALSLYFTYIGEEGHDSLDHIHEDPCCYSRRMLYLIVKEELQPYDYECYKYLSSS
jgi:hypothetical protein